MMGECLRSLVSRTPCLTDWLRYQPTGVETPVQLGAGYHLKQRGEYVD